MVLYIHPVAYASRSLYQHEKNDAISELETLAFVWAVKQFRAYLLGHKCTVYTNHAACTSLLNTPHPSAKLARWVMIIQDMNLEIRHRTGKSNTNADALSRNPVPDHITTEAQVLQLTSVEVQPQQSDTSSPEPIEDIGKLQRKDPKLHHIITLIESGKLPDDQKLVKKSVLERNQ